MKILKCIFAILLYLTSLLIIYNMISLYAYHKNQDFMDFHKSYFPSRGNASETIRKEIIDALYLSKDGRPASESTRIDTFVEKHFSKDEILILGTSSEEIVIGFDHARQFKHGDIHFLKNVKFNIENAYISTFGDVAWFSAIGYFKTMIKGLILPLRHSVILAKHGDIWKIHKTQSDWFYDTNLLLNKIVFSVIFSMVWIVIFGIRITLNIISWKLKK